MNLFKNIKNNVVILGVASFFTDVSSEMIYPVMPIFLTSVLGAPMSVMGLIEAIAESTASVLKAVSGWLSDRLRARRPFVVAGYSLSALSRPLLFLAFVWPVVLLARFLDRFGKGLRTSARDAMIADSSEASSRGRAFGFHRAMDSFGACIGPLLAILFLVVFKENLRAIFIIAFVPALLAVFTLIFFLKETPPKKAATRDFYPPSPSRQSVSSRASEDSAQTNGDLIPKSGELHKFLFASAVFAMGNSSDAFLIIRAKDLGLSTTFVILAYVLYNISYSVLSTPFGALSDRISRKKVMVIGYGVFALVYALFGLISSSGPLWILFPVYGFYIAMTDGVGRAFVSDMVAPQRRATALGAYHFMLGVFAFLASLIAGLLWTRIGASAPFVYGASCAALSAAAMAVFVKE